MMQLKHEESDRKTVRFILIIFVVGSAKIIHLSECYFTNNLFVDSAALLQLQLLIDADSLE